jgi:hypothetical protein
MQRRLASSRDTPKFCQSSPAIHVNLRCISTSVRDVMNEAERDRLVDNVVGHLADGVTESVLQRAFDYWRNVDTDLGNRIEKGVRAAN